MVHNPLDFFHGSVLCLIPLQPFLDHRSHRLACGSFPLLQRIATGLHGCQQLQGLVTGLGWRPGRTMLADGDPALGNLPAPARAVFQEVAPAGLAYIEAEARQLVVVMPPRLRPCRQTAW